MIKFAQGKNVVKIFYTLDQFVLISRGNEDKLKMFHILYVIFTFNFGVNSDSRNLDEIADRKWEGHTIGWSYMLPVSCST